MSQLLKEFEQLLFIMVIIGGKCIISHKCHKDRSLYYAWIVLHIIHSAAKRHESCTHVILPLSELG
jgi:hypothetical protein